MRAIQLIALMWGVLTSAAPRTPARGGVHELVGRVVNAETREPVRRADPEEYRMAYVDPGTYELRASYREGRSSEFDLAPATMATFWYGGSENSSQVTVRCGSSVPAGEYRVFLPEPSDNLMLMRPDVLQENRPNASLVTGGGGEQKTPTLPVAKVRRE